MDNIYSTLFGALFADYGSCEKVGRDTVGEYTIDTCCTIDQGWETAVWKNDGDMIIVGRYPSKEHAQAGHINWCAACALNPVKVWSVQTDSYEFFEKGNDTMTWEQAAKMCEIVYGIFVDWEERFFICPECDEPIYECDFNDFEICPVCEFEWEDAE